MKAFAILIWAAVFALVPCMANAGPEALVIKTQASAIVRQGDTDVKAIALEQALKNAVSEAVVSLTGADGPVIPTETTQMLSDHRAFITNYRVLTEDWIRASAETPQAEQMSGPQEGDTYNVWIEASIDIERLGEVLAKTRQGEASASLTVTILDLTEYKAFQALFGAIRKTPGVKDAAYETFSRGRITLTVRSHEVAQTLAQRLSAKIEEGFEVRSSGSKNISIKAVSKAGTAR